MIMLTQEERDKCADFLEQSAIGDDGLAQQLGGMPKVQLHYRTQAAHKIFVASFLRSIEEM